MRVAKDAPQRLHRIVQFGAYDVFAVLGDASGGRAPNRDALAAANRERGDDPIKIRRGRRVEWFMCCGAVCDQLHIHPATRQPAPCWLHETSALFCAPALLWSQPHPQDVY